MRRVIVSMNVTLDGFISGPGGKLDWHFPFWNDDMSQCACEQLSNMDTILAGRITYQTMAGYWPSAPDGCFANMMNSYTKIVFSATLQSAGWNNSQIVKENSAVEIARLKHQQGKDMIIYGSGSLVANLMPYTIIDEYRIWMHPVAIGKGTPFFKNLQDTMNLQLLRTRTFGSGVILLYYRPGVINVR